jgi:hypothetical protein
MVKGYPIPIPLQLQSIQPPLPLPLPPVLPSPQLNAELENDQMETDTLTNEQVDVHVDPKVVKIMTETNMIPAANVSNRNDELKEYGNSLNKSVLELNIAEQVALPSIENPSRLSRSSQPSMTMEARS